MLIPTSPDRTYRMNDMPRYEVASGGDDSITNWATTDALTFFINLGATFRVDGAICAITFIQTPMRGSDDCIRILNGNIAGYEA